MQDYKDFKIKEPVIIASTENYKVIQIQKNLDAFIKSQSEVKTEIKTEVKKAESTEEVKQEVKKEVAKPEIKSEKTQPVREANEVTRPTKRP